MANTPLPYIAYHPIFRLPLPEGHRFPMIKYELLTEQLLWEGVVSKNDFFSPEPIDKKYLKDVHLTAYLEKLFSLTLDKKEIRRIGFPLTTELIERELRIAEGTVQAALAAKKRGIGFNIAGGTHHAGADWGEGFCLLNDQAIAASYLIHQKQFRQILIVDLDVHQGNGTANIFQKEKRIFTFSIHGQNNFPFKKEQSDLDVGLADGTRGATYLTTLNKHLDMLFSSLKPDFVFFQAGVDVLETDKMGKLKLSQGECLQRDELVFDYCKRFSVPVQVSMGGGYSPRISDIVNAHANTFKAGISKLLK